MAVGPVTIYNNLDSALFHLGAPSRLWENTVTNSMYWYLCSNSYTPSAAHTTVSQLAGVITSGSGAPVPLTGQAVARSGGTTGVPQVTHFKSDNANFGASITATAKYVVCAMQSNTFDGGSNYSSTYLLFYIDLDTSSTSASMVFSGTPAEVQMPTDGWFQLSY